jgi:hypothetical protein
MLCICLLKTRRLTPTPYTSVSITKITRRITMHKNTRSILGKPFSNKGKTQQSFAIFSREDPPTP